MAFADEFSPQSATCDICGAMLGDEVVVQEFADGSLARLCAECASGVDLGESPPGGAQSRPSVWPDLPAETEAAPSGETDPLEKTRELLLPVTDLITLQGEMQAALERLAASLERFALEMITESQGRSAVQTRVRELEHELQKTRTQLTEAEFLLTAATRPGQSVAALPVAAMPAQPAPSVPEITVAPPPVAPPFESETPVARETPEKPESVEERRSGRDRREIRALPASPDDERRTGRDRRQAAQTTEAGQAPAEPSPAFVPVPPPLEESRRSRMTFRPRAGPPLRLRARRPSILRARSRHRSRANSFPLPRPWPQRPKISARAHAHFPDR